LVKSAANDVPRSNVFWATTWTASVAFHALLVFAIVRHAHPSIAPSDPPLDATTHDSMGATIAIDLPGFADGQRVDDHERNPIGDPIPARGGDVTPRLDTGTAGHGGEQSARLAAINLSDRDEDMRLSPDLLSRLDRDQEQHLRTSKDRQAMEDRRATTHPMELTFVSSGHGDREERRTPNARDPNLGALISATASMRGGDKGATENRVGDEETRAHEGASSDGIVASEPGLGVRDGRTGSDHRVSAAVAMARPDVTQAAVSIPSITKGRAKDDVESEQEVATAVRSLVHASAAGGISNGNGAGGSNGGGLPGVGADSGSGSHARPLGDGAGDIFDINTSDPRLVAYFRRLHAKVVPLVAHAFPKSASLDLKQGTVILEFTIDAEGHATVSWPPARPSGIDEYDRNCADALRKAMPFEPLPKELGKQAIRVRAPFEGNRQW
jgi:TonB family protein